MAGRRAPLLRRRRRVPHGVPLPAHAAHLHGAPAGGPTPIIDIMAQTPAIPASCQWALFLRNHDELTLEMVTDDERDYMYLAYSAIRACGSTWASAAGWRRWWRTVRRRDRAAEQPAVLVPGHADYLLRRRDRHGRQHLPRRPQRRAHARCSGPPTATPASPAPTRPRSTARRHGSGLRIPGDQRGGAAREPVVAARSG